MDLRTLKKEVHSLANSTEHATEFEKNWVKTIKSNSNKHLPFLQNISASTKEEINLKLAQIQDSLHHIKNSEVIPQKLQHYSRYLVNLKLSHVRDDHRQAARITSQMLTDDFMNLKTTITEVKQFSDHVEKLEKGYDEVNDLLHKELSLDETVALMNFPHRKYLHSLVKTADSQKRIVRHLGRHFVDLTRKSPLAKKRRK